MQPPITPPPSEDPFDRATQRALHHVERLGLLIITVATLVATGREIVWMIQNRAVLLEDLLLLFIYLEIFAMVRAYLQAGQLPIRFPLYIAIAAIARYIAIGMKGMDGMTMLMLAAAILVITLALLVVRYGSCKWPHNDYN